MEKTLQILNALEQDGVLGRYAIGGAMGATFYVEPLLTFDLDIFVLLPSTTGGLLTLAPLYEALRARGFVEEDECVNIEGVPVQFLPAYNALVEEALSEALETLYEQTPTRLLRPEPCWLSRCRPGATRTDSGCASCWNKRRWTTIT